MSSWGGGLKPLSATGKRMKPIKLSLATVGGQCLVFIFPNTHYWTFQASCSFSYHLQIFVVGAKNITEASIS